VVFHLTEKLRRKLHVPSLEIGPVEVLAHQRWYGNVVTAQRTQYLLATNAASLYSVVCYGRGITNDSNFLRHFLDCLKAQMNKDRLDLVYERCILPHAHNLTVLKTEDRSVLGSMNDMARACKFVLSSNDRSTMELSARLNETPYSALGYEFPIEVLQKMPVEAAD